MSLKSSTPFLQNFLQTRFGFPSNFRHMGEEGGGGEGGGGEGEGGGRGCGSGGKGGSRGRRSTEVKARGERRPMTVCRGGWACSR